MTIGDVHQAGEGPSSQRASQRETIQLLLRSLTVLKFGTASPRGAGFRPSNLALDIAVKSDDGTSLAETI